MAIGFLKNFFNKDKDDEDPNKDTDQSYDSYRGRGGFLKAMAESSQRDREEDRTMEKAKKALSAANAFKSGSFKVNDDTTVMPGYMDPGFEYTIPGRKGFGDMIGSGIGFLAGNMIMPGAGGKYGAALGGNIGSRF